MKVNWRKSVDDGLIADYAHNVCQDVRPLLSHHFQPVSEINKEIRLVSKTLIEAASKHLSSKIFVPVSKKLLVVSETTTRN